MVGDAAQLQRNESNNYVMLRRRNVLQPSAAFAPKMLAWNKQAHKLVCNNVLAPTLDSGCIKHVHYSDNLKDALKSMSWGTAPPQSSKQSKMESPRRGISPANGKLQRRQMPRVELSQHQMAAVEILAAPPISAGLLQDSCEFAQSMPSSFTRQCLQESNAYLKL